MMRRLTVNLVALAAGCAVVPAQSACIDMDQARQLVSFALPAAARTVVDRCRAVLPASSYVARFGDALVARLRSAAQAREDMTSVRAALEALSGDRIPPGLSDRTLSSMASDMVAAKVGKLTPDQCRMIDPALDILDPLPPENLTRLIVQLMRLGAKSDPHLRFCADPAARP